MTLLERIRTLVRADAHGVLDSLEERSLLLRQYVREADLELSRKRVRLEALIDEEKRLSDARERLGQQIRALDSDISLALEDEQEDLARFAIRRLLPRREEARDLAAQSEQRAEERETLSEKLRVQEGEFEDLKRRVQTYLHQRDAGLSGADPLGEPCVADEEIELELMRRRLQPMPEGAS